MGAKEFLEHTTVDFDYPVSKRWVCNLMKQYAEQREKELNDKYVFASDDATSMREGYNREKQQNKELDKERQQAIVALEQREKELEKRLETCGKFHKQAVKASEVIQKANSEFEQREKELMGYEIRHKITCIQRKEYSSKCTCGLEELLNK